MKNYQDPDILHGHGKATPKPKAPNPLGKIRYSAPSVPDQADYEVVEHFRSNRALNRVRGDINLRMMLEKGDTSCLHSIQVIRRHLPLNRRPSRRALKRNAAAILAK
jgi:hypothetical protein